MLPVNFQFIDDKSPTFSTALLASTSGRLYYSGNGIDWSFWSTGTSIVDMCSNGVLTVGVGGGNAYQISDLTGVSSYAMPNNGSCIATNTTGRWLSLYGRDVMVSDNNGQNWSTTSNVFEVGFTPNDVAYYNGYWVATEGYWAYYSSNGTSWSGKQRLVQEDPDPAHTYPNLSYIVPNPAQTWAILYSNDGGSCSAFASSDPTTWELDNTVNVGAYARGVDWSGSDYIASGYQEPQTLKFYIDGVETYSNTFATAEDGQPSCSIWFAAEAMYVMAVTISGNSHVFTSFDGSAWTDQGVTFSGTVHSMCTPQTL